MTMHLAAAAATTVTAITMDMASCLGQWELT
jgi:hypothetical protein